VVKYLKDKYLDVFINNINDSLGEVKMIDFKEVSEKIFNICTDTSRSKEEALNRVEEILKSVESKAEGELIKSFFKK